MQFINLTPHEVVIYNLDGSEVILRIPPSGKELRVGADMELIGDINGIPLYKTVFVLNEEEIMNLPYEPGVFYIVSTVLLQAMKEYGIYRSDFIAPNTNPKYSVRDVSGKILGVKGFQIL